VPLGLKRNDAAGARAGSACGALCIPMRVRCCQREERALSGCDLYHRDRAEAARSARRPAKEARGSGPALLLVVAD
jgi:hypothetical protein